MAFKTKNQIWVSLVNALIAAKSRLTDVSIRSELGKIFRAFSGEMEEAYTAIEDVKNSAYINDATGADLDRRAADYPALGGRKAATFATVSDYQFAGKPGTVIPQGFLVQKFETIYRYSTDSQVTLDAEGNATVSITATASGENHRAEPGQITEFVSSIPSGLDRGSNPSRTSGGDWEEQDEELRARIIGVQDLLAAGTPFAVANAAQTVPGCRYAIHQADYPQIGKDTVMISDGYGQFYSALQKEVINAISNYQASGRQIEVSPAIAANVIASVSLTLATGVSLDSVKPAYDEALKAAILASWTFGSTVYPSQAKMTGISGVTSVPKASLRVAIDCPRIPGISVYDFSYRSLPVERVELPCYYDSSTQWLSIGNTSVYCGNPGSFSVTIETGDISTVNIYVDPASLPVDSDRADTMVFLYSDNAGMKMGTITLPILRKTEVVQAKEQVINA